MINDISEYTIKSLLYPQHSITNTDMCLNIFGGLRGCFYFLTKSRHKDSKRSNIIFPAVPPYFLCNVGVGQNLSYILRKDTQQFILDWCQM